MQESSFHGEDEREKDSLLKKKINHTEEDEAIEADCQNKCNY